MNRLFELLESRQMASTTPLAITFRGDSSTSVVDVSQSLKVTASTPLSNAYLRNKLQRALDTGGMPGAVAAVIDSQGNFFSAAKGVRVNGLPAKVLLDDVFHLGSCGKAMTATVAAKLVEQGVIEWGSTIGKVFPKLLGKINPTFAGVRLDQLLAMRGAMPDISDIPAELQQEIVALKGSGKEQRDRFLPKILKLDQVGKTGDYHYSNAAYSVAAWMMEKVTGENFDSLINRVLFKPLGMTSVRIGSPGSNDPTQADAPRGHDENGNPLLPQDQIADQPIIAPAGLYSMTINDWSKFVNLQLGRKMLLHTSQGLKWGQIISNQSIELMQKPFGSYYDQTLDGVKQGFGLGWAVTDAHGKRTVWYDGSNDYWLGRVVIDRKHQQAVLMVGNQLGSQENPVGPKTFDPLLATLAHKIGMNATLDSRQLHLSTLRGIVQASVAGANVPGMSLALLSNDGTLLKTSAGVRQRGTSKAMLSTDLLNIGSCAKAMTSSLAAILIEKGLINWNTTIEQAFPEISGKINPVYRTVTLEQLLSNRGGVPELVPEAIRNQINNGTGSPQLQRAKLMIKLLTQKPSTKVGEFAYSNNGYTVAGTMLERAGGGAFESLMDKYVFRPLGMTSVTVGHVGSDASLDQPRGHDSRGNPVLPSRQEDPVVESPAGAFNMTLDDWSKFVTAHLGRKVNGIRLLSDAQLAKLHTPLSEDLGGARYALGWFVRDLNGISVLSHDGSNGSWLARAVIIPSTGRALMLASNQFDPAGTLAADTVTDNELIRATLSAQ